MKKLTKGDILKGKERTEIVHIDGYDADVVIRPLTDGELSEIFGIIGSIPLKDDGTPDAAKIDVVKNFQALRLAVALGTVEPSLKVEDVEEMKFGVPEYLGTRILEISGVASGTGAKKKEE
jgi:hypothetical protein